MGMYCQEVEMILAAPEIQFPCTIKLLEDPNMWVADNRASCNNTGSYDGMVNQRVPKTVKGVALPDGQAKITTMIGNIRGTLCNKNGAKLNSWAMKNVKYCKENKYNLFSATKRQKDGWRLYGDRN
eukprot:11951091-Ditylum_brightwellii.AAC.1